MHVWTEWNRFCIASMGILILMLAICGSAGAATTLGKITITPTSPIQIKQTFVNVTPSEPPCPSGCECIEDSEANARWGTDGYIQCRGTGSVDYNLPCADAYRDAGMMYVTAHPKHCFRKKFVTTTIGMGPAYLDVRIQAPPASSCLAPCECMQAAAAQEKWGTNGYTLCNQSPCVRQYTSLEDSFYTRPDYCFKRNVVTEVERNNIPVITSTAMPVKKLMTLKIPPAYPDEDSVPAARDNCRDVYNPDQFDMDKDGVGDPCDNCWSEPNMFQDDRDGDCALFHKASGYWYSDKAGNSSYWINDPKCGDACDNCPDLGTIDMTDTNNDGTGDLCSGSPAGNYSPDSEANLPPLKTNVGRVDFRTSIDS
jgi:hypothetical protein